MKPIVITLKPSIVAGLVIAIVVLTYGYITGGSQCQKAITFFVGAVAAGSTFLAAYFAGKAMNRSIRATEDNAKAEKMRLSYQILQTISNSVSSETKELLMKEIEDDTPKDTGKTDQYHRIKENTELNQAVIHVLGAFEDMAIAIKRGIADEEFLKDSMIVMIDIYFRAFRGYIFGLREEHKKENLYNELEDLHNKWNKTR